MWEGACLWISLMDFLWLSFRYYVFTTTQFVIVVVLRIVIGNDRDRERATQRGCVLTSSVGLWKGPLGVRLAMIP
jgi:hypothetical protein